MTDRERIERLYRAAQVVALAIEDITGEMSLEQQVRVVGILLGFWCAEEDTDYPRGDRRSWKDLVSEALKP